MTKTNTKPTLNEAVEIINSLADELESFIKEKWGFDERLKRQYNRDMADVIWAREFVERVTE